MASVNDTIFALSSGAGRAGVAVIRLSGPKAFSVAAALCGNVDVPPDRKLRLRVLHDAQGERIDEALVAGFAGPSSFTGDDVVELHCHGSPAVVRAISMRVLGLGAQPATAGAFTRRALHNGKMSLLDVEALSDVLTAETELQRRAAVLGSPRFIALAQLWRDDVLALRVHVEALIDFSDEDDVGTQLDSDLKRDIELIVAGMDRALAGLSNREQVRRGFRVALLGPPNAGKSTLLNALAAREIAITSPVPGTTRDSIEVSIDLDGIPVVIVDTAGLRDTVDAIESEGIRRSLSAAESSDLALWLSPVGDPVPAPSERFVTVTTQADLAAMRPEGLFVSARTGESLNDLVRVIREAALDGLADIGSAAVVWNERQAAQLRICRDALERAAAAGGLSLDIRAEEMRIASRALDGLVGRISDDEILGAIFARFCIGK